MYKFMSWLIIAFIGLVPLGVFFDTKKSQKPNIEQSFMKREKRATNSSQCAESCELEFVKILNSELWFNSPAEGIYRLHFPNDILPNDLKKKNLFLKGQDNIESVLNFYKNNGIDNTGILITIPKIINVKIKFQLIKSQLVQICYITSFYAEMSNKN